MTAQSHDEQHHIPESLENAIDDTPDADTVYQEDTRPPNRFQGFKDFALTNTGMVVIAFSIMTLLALVHNWDRWFFDQGTAVAGALETTAAGRPLETMPAIPQATFTPPTANTPLANEAVDALKNQLTQLTLAVNQLNERVAALATAADKHPTTPKKLTPAKYPFTLIGTFLDQTRNVWLVQVTYQGRVLTRSAGERFGGWQVHQVTEQGAVIR